MALRDARRLPAPRPPRACLPLFGFLLIAAGAAAQPVVVESGWTLIRTFDAPGAMSARLHPADGLVYYGRRGSSADGLYRIEAFGLAVRLATGSNTAGLAIDPTTGDLFTSEDYGGVIYRTAFGGTGRSTWVSGFRSGDDDPVGMAFAPADYAGSIVPPGGGLLVDRGNGGYDDVWSWSPLSAEGEILVHPDNGTLVDPVDVAVDRTTVYVADSGLTAIGALYILEPDSSLTPLATSEPIASPAGIDVDPWTGDLVVLDQNAGRVVRVDPATGAVNDLLTGLTTTGEKWAGVGFSVDGRRLLVTDYSAGRIHVLARCDATGLPDLDCDDDGVWDLCEVWTGAAPDCNHNDRPDECDVATPEGDCNNDGVPDDCPVCPPVQVVFIMDTSDSMDDEASVLCSSMGVIVDYLGGADLTVQSLPMGICDLPGGAYSCLETTVVGSLGTAVPGSPPAGLETLGACPGGIEVCQEDWGLATAVVAGLYPWAPAGESTRLIIPLSDEGPWCGDPVSAYDSGSISHAIAVARQNGVIVSPITGSGSSAAVLALAQALADSTGGTHFRSTTGASGIAGAIVDLVLAACALAGDCDANGLLDECEIAAHPSLDFNGDDVLDRCQRGVAAVDPRPAPTARPRLLPNHPNPFNPRTILSFDLPAEQHVTLAVYSLDGRRLCTLAEGRYAAGLHRVEWDGRDARRLPLASGVYIYRLAAGRTVETRRMTLLR